LPCPYTHQAATRATLVQQYLLDKHTARNAASHAPLNEVQPAALIMTPSMPKQGKTSMSLMTLHQKNGDAT
jgi:hypothetical protein